MRSTVSRLLAVGTAVVLGFGLWRVAGPAPPEADPVAGSGYRIEKGVVSWRPLDRGSQIALSLLTLGMATNSEAVQGRAMPLADPESFRAVGWAHGLDRQHVWFEGRLLSGADPASFIPFEHGFGRDAVQLWRGVDPVMPVSGGEVVIWSPRIFTIAGQAWLAGADLLPLPESPAVPPAHACRDWFVMNGAAWNGPHRVLEVGTAPLLIDCDGSTRSTHVDGVPVENLADNAGLLLGDGADIWRLRLDRSPARLMSLAAPVIETRLIPGRPDRPSVLLARTATGEGYAASLGEPVIVQPLGGLSGLPAPDGIPLGQGFMADGRYFTLTPDLAPGGPVIEDHGPAKAVNEYVLAERSLFYGGTVVARPGRLPIRDVAHGTVMVGPSCLSFGTFITDLEDPEVDFREVMSRCDAMRRPETILYDGLRIGFIPGIAGSASGDCTPPGWVVGEVRVENASTLPRTLEPSFLSGMTLGLNRVPLSPPKSVLPPGPIVLQPGEAWTWRPEAEGADPEKWRWWLRMLHSPERQGLFGKEPFDVSWGDFAQTN